MLPCSSPPAGTVRIIIVPAVWCTDPPPVHTCFCCHLQTYNIRTLSYCPLALQLSFPAIHLECKKSVERIMCWVGLREKCSCLWICTWLGPELLSNSKIIQVEYLACFWQRLPSALKPFVIRSRGAKNWGERRGIKLLSEGKKDILIKLPDVSVQKSFPFPYCKCEQKHFKVLCLTWQRGGEEQSLQDNGLGGFCAQSSKTQKQESQDPSILHFGS